MRRNFPSSALLPSDRNRLHVNSNSGRLGAATASRASSTRPRAWLQGLSAPAPSPRLGRSRALALCRGFPEARNLLGSLHTTFPKASPRPLPQRPGGKAAERTGSPVVAPVHPFPPTPQQQGRRVAALTDPQSPTARAQPLRRSLPRPLPPSSLSSLGAQDRSNLPRGRDRQPLRFVQETRGARNLNCLSPGKG